MKKKYFILIIILLFVALCINLFAQTQPYPFEVKTSGKGSRAVILIPGFACSGKVWNETLSLLEKDYTCHTLTMAGFAGVPAQSKASFTGWEKGIASYITQNKIEKPIIIGHSMGGGLAMALAADYPELISKIVVVDALPCLSAMMDPTFQSKAQADCAPIVSKMTGMDAAQFYQMQKMSMPRLLADTSKLEMVVDWSVKSDRNTFAGMYCDFSNTDLRGKMNKITCPSLVLLEAYFVNFKPAIDEQFKGLKNASLHYANKGLHFIMYDDPEFYQGQIGNFMKR